MSKKEDFETEMGWQITNLDKVGIISEGDLMKIHFYATFRPLVGGKTIEIPGREGMTVRQMLATMMDMFPVLRQELFNKEGELLSHVHVFLNGRNVRHIETTWETVIGPEDTINIFPPVGGG
jgi:MoaD family protein